MSYFGCKPKRKENICKIINILPVFVKFGLVRLVIEQEICIFLTLFLQIQRFFLVILNLHNSKTTCDRRKPIVDWESTLKNMSIKRNK